MEYINTINKLDEKEIKFLKELAIDLNTQNQRSTSYPVWKVCDIERKIGVSDEIADGYCVVDINTDRVIVDPIELLEENNKNEKLKNEYSLKKALEYIQSDSNESKYKYCGYLNVIKIEKVFFTERAAEEYFANNRYKLSDEAYIYVDSAYGNNQIKKLLDILKKI